MDLRVMEDEDFVGLDTQSPAVQFLASAAGILPFFSIIFVGVIYIFIFSATSIKKKSADADVLVLPLDQNFAPIFPLKINMKNCCLAILDILF